MRPRAPAVKQKALRSCPILLYQSFQWTVCLFLCWCLLGYYTGHRDCARLQHGPWLLVQRYVVGIPSLLLNEACSDEARSSS